MLEMANSACGPQPRTKSNPNRPHTVHGIPLNAQCVEIIKEKAPVAGATLVRLSWFWAGNQPVDLIVSANLSVWEISSAWLHSLSNSSQTISEIILRCFSVRTS